MLIYCFPLLVKFFPLRVIQVVDISRHESVSFSLLYVNITPYPFPHSFFGWEDIREVTLWCCFVVGLSLAAGLGLRVLKPRWSHPTYMALRTPSTRSLSRLTLLPALRTMCMYTSRPNAELGATQQLGPNNMMQNGRCPGPLTCDVSPSTLPSTIQVPHVANAGMPIKSLVGGAIAAQGVGHGAATHVSA